VRDLLGVAHWLAAPCKTVSVFSGLIQYEKRCDTNGPQKDFCAKLGQRLEEKQQELDVARQELAHLRRVASEGDRKAEHLLPQREQFVQGLEREAARLREEIARVCSGR